ncbi:MAG: hypothetical protein WCJ29_02135 [bacterium]
MSKQKDDDKLLKAMGATPISPLKEPRPAFDRHAVVLNKAFDSEEHWKLFRARYEGKITTEEYDAGFDAIIRKIEAEELATEAN